MQAIAHVQEHKQKWFSGTLCPLSLERNHPMESFFIQYAAFLNPHSVDRKSIQT